MKISVLSVLLFFFFPIAVWSADGDTFTANTIEGVEVTYTIVSENNKTCKVGYTYDKNRGVRAAVNQSTISNVTIPSVVNGYTVKQVEKYAFSSCKKLTSIIIPDGVTSIGVSAFSGCTNAVTITIPNSVKDIADYVFSGCESLAGINIPEGVPSIGVKSFFGCKSLTEVHIPSSVTTIYEQAFYGCNNLAFVSLPDNLLYIGTSAFSGSSITSLTLPKSFTTSYGVNNISYSGSSIGSINTLNKVVISNGVASLYEVFQYCYFIETVICYNETPINAYNCWNSANNGTLYVPRGYKERYEANNYWKGFSRIIEMNNNDDYSDIGNSFITSDITYKITNINPREVQVGLLSGAISKQAVGSIEIPAFITNPNNNNEYTITSINTNAFYGCSKISNIIIPQTVTSIGEYAFSGCSSLTSVTVKMVTPVDINSNTFSNRSNATLFVPAGSKAAYETAAYWKEFKEIVEMPDPLTGSGTEADPYLLYDANDFVNLANNVNAGTLYNGEYFKVAKSQIDFNGISYIPIGNVSKQFAGNFDGNNVVIKNLTTSKGLFGYLGKTGNVSSVVIDESCIINGTMDLGGLVSVNEGTVSNCVNRANVVSTYYRVGGICGDNMGTIVNCKNYGNISTSNTTTGTIGGIAGDVDGGSIIDCENYGNIIGKEAWVGGIVGLMCGFNKPNSSLITGCTNKGNVTGNYDVGGIMGHSSEPNASISNNLVSSCTITAVGTDFWGGAGAIATTFNTVYSNNYYTEDVVVKVGNNTYMDRTPRGLWKNNAPCDLSENDGAVLLIESSTNNYILSINALGNGSAVYNETTIRNGTNTFNVTEETNATITFKPDSCYKIKSVKVNSTNVTSSIKNDQYTISNIKTDTKVEVLFEAIPPTTYTLSIKAVGYGLASYNSSTIRNTTNEFTVVEGTSAIITFTPDNGYKVKSVKKNGKDVSSVVANGQYTIGDIQGNTTVEVEFDAITHTLSIKATGNGVAVFDGTNIRNKTTSFSVNEGSLATVKFTPDSGYKIKSVKVNSTNVTSNVTNNQYTISNINADTTLEVEFEAITYTLSIKASGNGVAVYDGTNVRNKTATFTLNEGSSATVKFTPDSGYKIKSVKVNSTDVTSSVTSSQYTISNIAADTTLEVEFEVIPPTAYTLYVKAAGNGSASYNSIVIRNTTKEFTVVEGTSATITLTPDYGYKIKSVKKDGTDVTSIIANSQYIISNIQGNTTVEVEFEAITHTLSIKANGYGSASYNSTTIRNTTKTFTVNEGTAHTITFSSDSGYIIKSLKKNGTDVTSSVANNQYTISNITADTSLEVEFEAIIHTLSIKATGNGVAVYDGTNVRNKTATFTINEGSLATVKFTPDSGYKIKSVKVNSTDVTSSITNSQYTISNIAADTTLEVEFEAIPPTVYTLSVKVIGNGSASYNSIVIRNTTKEFTVVEGTSATITLTPDYGYKIKSVKKDGTDIISAVVNNQYTISNINTDTTLEVEFDAIPPTTYSLSIKASGNGSVSYNGMTIRGNANFTVNEGTGVTIKLVPDASHKTKNVKVNGTDVTSKLKDNTYTIGSISSNTTVEVEFESITHTLSVKASGNGLASYNGTNVRNKTATFTINEGSSATVKFTPDSGYKIKSVKVNSTNVTSSITNNQYTINNITADTTFEVEFEAIPPTTYTLYVKAGGNGSASYNSTVIRNTTKEFTIVEGTSVTITLTPDNGYKVKSVKKDGTDITSAVVNNQYTISNIKADTTLEVEFEAIPPTTYTLSINVSGNGSVSYNEMTIRGNANFTVNEGTEVTIKLVPDASHKTKNIKVNGTDVTTKLKDNTYTIGSISSNTTVEVEFESITHSLSVKASGNGLASYNGTNVRNKTTSFTINEGSSATVKFTPDSGYKIKSVKVNSTIVTSSVTNSQFTISNIAADTTLEVEFEAIPPTTYTLSIKAAGNGSASYNSMDIRNTTREFTVVEGTSATITFTPDNGYYVKSVMLNGIDDAANVKNNQYSISNITNNQSVEVTFSTNNGEILLEELWALLDQVRTKLEKATNTIANNYPDVKNNYEGVFNTYSSNLTSLIQNTAVISSEINAAGFNSDAENSLFRLRQEAEQLSTRIDESLENALKDNQELFEKMKNAVGLLQQKLDEAKANIVDNKYVQEFLSIDVAAIQADIDSLEKDVNTNTQLSYSKSFQPRELSILTAIEGLSSKAQKPSLVISASGNGTVYCKNKYVRNDTILIHDEGTQITAELIPDYGYRVKSVILNSVDVKPQNNLFVINDIKPGTTFEVEFEVLQSSISSRGVNYIVNSFTDKTVKVTKGDYGQVLEVPSTIIADGEHWRVNGIEADALTNNEPLAAVLWYPDAAFTAAVSNPNLLLYVTNADLAPAAITNVVVNGIAERIVLNDAYSGNNFYCPQTFTARSISYSHRYSMMTGIGEARGWETLALPFDVQKVTHEEKGEIVPFASWHSGDEAKPFWLMQLGNSGWENADVIKANTPYIISMPNNNGYKTEFMLNGMVTFSAENATIEKTDNLLTGSYRGRTFMPSFTDRAIGNGAYSLNVSNEYEANVSGLADGSHFVLNMRKVHPFEAYMRTSSSNTRSISINEDMEMNTDSNDEMLFFRVYNLNGQMMKSGMGLTNEDIIQSLPSGVFIINRKKVIAK